jgi:hypothetical protein
MFGQVIPSKTKNNFTATTAPTVNDDKSEGYKPGSIIYIPTTGATYICVSNAEGAAVWRLLSGEQYISVWNPATNTPTLADGIGAAGTYYISSVDGTVDLGSGSQSFTAGDKVIASASVIWQKQDGGVSYVPEDSANKENTTLDTSTTKYPTNRLVKEQVDLKQATLTDSNFGTFSNSLTAKTAPVDADTFNIVDSAAANVEKKLSWLNVKATLKTYFDAIYTTTSAVATQITTALASYLPLSGGTMTGNLSAPKVSVGTINTPSIETVGEGLTSGPSLAGVTQTARRTTSRIGNAELNFHNHHLHSATSWIKNLFVRSKSDTDAHVSVASGDIIEESIYGGRFQSGGTGAYYPAVSIKKKIGTGTVSGTSMPGELSIEVSPNGAVVPVEAFKIESDKTAKFYGAINEAPEVTIASASSVAIGAATSNNIAISGTTTITSFDTVASGIRRSVRATGAFQITNSAALVTANGKNIVTKANDNFEMESLGSGNWIMTNFSPVDGRIMANAVNNQTGTTYTLAITDLGNDIVATQASAQTYTLPQTSTVAFPIGSKIKIINSTSSGTLTFVKQGAETLNGNTTLIAGATAFVEKTSATSWEVFGGTATIIEQSTIAITETLTNAKVYDVFTAPDNVTIVGFSLRNTSATTAGTYTAAINGTTITGLSAIANSTTRTRTDPTGLNTMTYQQVLTYTPSGSTLLVDAFITVFYTRAF